MMLIFDIIAYQYLPETYPIFMNTITRVLHSIFDHRKDIVYRRSSSVLISVIRISYHTKTYEAYGNIRVKPNQPCNYLNRGHKSKVNISGQYPSDRSWF